MKKTRVCLLANEHEGEFVEVKHDVSASGSNELLCETCEDTRLVCEDHPNKVWGGVSNSPAACNCGGAGMPCSECCFET